MTVLDARAKRLDVWCQRGYPLALVFVRGVGLPDDISLAGLDLQVWVQAEVDGTLAVLTPDSALYSAEVDASDAEGVGIVARFTGDHTATVVDETTWVAIANAATDELLGVGVFRTTNEGTGARTVTIPLGPSEAGISLELYAMPDTPAGGSALPEGTAGEMFRIGEDGETVEAVSPNSAGSWLRLNENGHVPDVHLSADVVRESEMDSAISAAIDDLVGGAPGALDTLNELAAALGDDEAFATSVTNALAGKLDTAHNSSGTAHPDLREASTATADPILALDPSWYAPAASTAVQPGVGPNYADRASQGDLVAAALVGLSEIPDMSGSGRPLVNSAGGLAPVPAHAWTGDRLLGQWSRLAPAGWPMGSIDFTATCFLLPGRRDPDNMWIEILLATIDEEDDWFEPAFVYSEEGIRFGLNFMDDASEVDWVSEVLPDPHREHTYRLTLDPASGAVALYIDDVLFDSETLAGAPFTLGGPSTSDLVLSGRKGVVIESSVLLDELDGEPYLEISAADQTGWTPDGGVVAPPFESPRFLRGGFNDWAATAVDIAADEDRTWVVSGRLWEASSASGGGVWLGSNTVAMLGGAAGWGLLGAPSFSLPFAFAVSSGGAPAIASAELPDGECLVIAELDRTEGELRLIVDGVTVATADASGVGAIATGQPMHALSGYGDLAYMATFDRLLTEDEKAILAAAPIDGRIAAVQGRAGPFIDLTDVFPTRPELDEALAEVGAGTVDAVSNVAQNRILGRTASGPGDSEELTAAQVRDLLGLAGLYAPPSARFVSGKIYSTPNVQRGGTREVRASRAVATPMLLDSPVTIDALQVDLSAVVATGTPIDLHIFADSNGYPTGPPLASTSVTTSGTSAQVLLGSTGSPVTLTPGLYWRVIHNRDGASNHVTARGVAATQHLDPMPYSPATTSGNSCYLSNSGAVGTSAIPAFPAISAVTEQNQGPEVQFRVA